VPQQKVYIIERLGKFHATRGAGFHVRIPFVDVIVNKSDLRTRQSDFTIDAKTKDNVTVTMKISAQYKISCYNGGRPEESGIWRSYYVLANPVKQMGSYLIDALRSSVPKYSLDEVYDKKDSIARDVNETVNELMVSYGYDIVNTLITDIALPKDVETAMNKINAAQREKEAAQSLAEAEKIKVVTEATAKAEAAEQAGKGIALQRMAIAKGIASSIDTIQKAGMTNEEANKMFMYTQWVDMMEEFAKSGKASTVVLPNDFQEANNMFDQLLAANQATK
jgi:regulator of protease activity HflC (stomatin/prohibitin superfamily)